LGVEVAKQFAPKHPVHVIDIHGTKDAAVPIEGGMVTGQGGLCIGVTNMIDLWVKSNGCKTPPTVEDLPKKTEDSTHVHRITYGAGAKGAEVVLYVVDGLGHNWAGTGTANPKAISTTRELHAEEVVWEFFKNHPKAE
jgi:polyhydroxybutyrate depolymerase